MAWSSKMAFLLFCSLFSITQNRSSTPPTFIKKDISSCGLHLQGFSSLMHFGLGSLLWRLSCAVQDIGQCHPWPLTSDANSKDSQLWQPEKCFWGGKTTPNWGRTTVVPESSRNFLPNNMEPLVNLTVSVLSLIFYFFFDVNVEFIYLLFFSIVEEVW